MPRRRELHLEQKPKTKPGWLARFVERRVEMRLHRSSARGLALRLATGWILDQSGHPVRPPRVSPNIDRSEKPGHRLEEVHVMVHSGILE
jgi:hypothetical protein